MTSETQILNTIDTAHEDIINDAVLDYYGTTLATAAHDGKIKLFDVRNGQQRKIAELTEHTSPVWQIAWAHPSFGDILASCSYDGDTIIYKKNVNNKYQIMYKDKMPKSTNSVCWAPVEFGLILAVACANENVYILRYKNNSFEKQIILAHSVGARVVSFAPGNTPSSLFKKGGDQKSTLRLVSGGEEARAIIWEYDENKNKWIVEDTLEAHTDWIKDVAWAPNIGLPEEQIATCSSDRSVIIWSRNYIDNSNTTNNNSGKNSTDTNRTIENASTDQHDLNKEDENLSNYQNQNKQFESENENAKRRWRPTTLPPFTDVISHVSWSLTGGILACSGGVDHVSLWKQDLSGQWQKINDVNDDLLNSTKNNENDSADNIGNDNGIIAEIN